jgi:hypothetical protein
VVLGSRLSFSEHLLLNERQESGMLHYFWHLGLDCCTNVTAKPLDNLGDIKLLIIVWILDGDLVRQLLKFQLILFDSASLFQSQQLLHILPVVVGTKFLFHRNHESCLGVYFMAKTICFQP